MIAPFQPEKAKVLVFDVDDTLTRNTIILKADVWKELFADHLEKLQEARELYEYTGKGDRYNIIAHIIEEPQEGCKENVKVIAFAQKFEEMTLKSVRTNDMHPDDIAALAELRERFEGNMYVLSAAPQNAVRGNIGYFMQIHPELKDIFVDIIGTPMDNGKGGELLKIADRCDVQPNEIAMIGDGGSDYTGAIFARTQFIGVVSGGKRDAWEGEFFPKVTSVAQIPSLFSEI